MLYVIYWQGYDPTADGLHLGSFVTLMALCHLQRHGHTPVVVLGGCTGLIGDPSGRESERTLLSEDVVASNCQNIGLDALSIFRNCGKPETNPIIINNLDIYHNLNTISFLRDIGKHFRVNVMMRKDSVSKRMESQEGISFTEFSYQLLQAHDFYILSQQLKVKAQIGGSDQWGNITSGIEYCKKRGVDNLGGCTLPLMVSKNGEKLGKSAGNAVWLSDKKTSHYDLYQYLYQTTTDDTVKKWLKLMTFLDLKEIDDICARGNGDGQKVLAKEVVALIRGPKAAQEAEEMSKSLFGGSSESESNVVMDREKLDTMSVIDIALELGMIESKKEGKRMMAKGAIYVNEEKIEDPTAKVGQCDQSFRLRVGKKKRVQISIK